MSKLNATKAEADKHKNKLDSMHISKITGRYRVK